MPASKLYYGRDLFLGLVSLPLCRLFPNLESPRVDLTGIIAIVTGGNSGIGLEIALDLARQGATVYLACRNVSKADVAVSHITSEVPSSKGRIQSLLLDLSSLSSVRACAKKWESLNNKKIDLLFHNGGIAHGQEYTTDGFPTIYAANFLGSYLLTHLLEPHLSTNARIIFTSSAGQYGGFFSPTFSLRSIKQRVEHGYHVPAPVFRAGKPILDSALYNQTKAMQVAFAKLLQSRFDRKAAEAGTSDRMLAHAFQPGFVHTPILAQMAEGSFLADPVFWFLKKTYTWIGLDASQGAATGLWLASTDDEAVIGEGMGGGYWDRMTRRVSNADMMSDDLLERFWVRWEADAGVEWR